MHRFDQHESAEFGIIRRLPNDEPRLVRLSIRRTRDEILFSFVFEIRETFARSQRRRRVIDRTRPRNRSRNRWQRNRSRSLRKVWSRSTLPTTSTLSASLSLLASQYA